MSTSLCWTSSTLSDCFSASLAIDSLGFTDWSSLESPHEASPEIIDELDVADVISEAEHAYVSPAPAGGWTTLDILDDETGARRFDGGRIIPAGAIETFVVRKSWEARQVRIVVRVDDGTRGLRLRTSRRQVDLVVSPPSKEGARTWREATALIDAPAVGETLVLEASMGAYRNFHVWIRR